MKVLLINPTGGPQEEYGALARAGTEMPQLGLVALAASLKAHKINTKVLDTHLQKVNIASLLDLIGKEQFDIVGFSVYITTMHNALTYAKAIKEKFPHLLICVGGPQVTLTPETFRKKFIDYIFIGEADHSLVQLIDALMNGNVYPHIKGVLYNTGSDFEGNAELHLVEDLDQLPLIDLEEFYDPSLLYPPIHMRGKKVINVISVRGCPYQCTFCAAAEINGRKIRKMSADRFLDYLTMYANKGYDSFMIYDDTFTVDRKRVLQIAEGILKRKLKIYWNCWGRVDRVDLKLLTTMHEAGCYLIMFGCESLHEKTLQLLKKGFSVQRCFEGIEIAKEAQLLVSASFMIGLPRETREDIIWTIHKACETRLDFALFPIFEPFAGTPIYSICQQEGAWIAEKYTNTLLTSQNEVWVPNTISRKEIENLARKAHTSFYLRKHFLCNTLPQIIINLPFKRKMRFLYSGIDYFLLSKFKTKKSRLSGSKYK